MRSTFLWCLLLFPFTDLVKGTRVNVCVQRNNNFEGKKMWNKYCLGLFTLRYADCIDSSSLNLIMLDKLTFPPDTPL